MSSRFLFGLSLGLLGCSSENPFLATNGTDLASALTADLASPLTADLADVAAPDLAQSGTGHDYGSDGPESDDSFTAMIGNFTVSIHLPQSAGAHPAVVLASGLQQPAAAYEPYAKRLASWGIIAILRDDPGVLGSSTQLGSDLGVLIGSWLPAQNGDPTSRLYQKIDLSRIGLAGHSRGGQATLLAAEGDLHGKVRAWFGIDPVDSAPMANAPRARTQLANLGIPTAFLGEITDSGGGTACAPAADNYQVLFAASTSPSVRVDALGADHTQFEDSASCSLCNFCQKGSADGAQVLSYSVRYVTAFFARELLGDSSVGPAFEGAGGPADIAAGRVNISAK